MRLFVAVEIDDSLREKLADVQAQLEEPAVKLVERHNLHLTLQFLGEVSEEHASSVQDALRTVKLAPFEINIAGIGTFPANSDRINVVWAGCSGRLTELASKVGEVLEPLGFKRDNEFSPHLTIARVKQRPDRLARAVENLKNVKIGKQTVNSFVLKRSTLTPSGPIYEDVEVFSLEARM